MAKPTRNLVADDHAPVRGLIAKLLSTERDWLVGGGRCRRRRDSEEILSRFGGAGYSNAANERHRGRQINTSILSDHDYSERQFAWVEPLYRGTQENWC